MPFVKGQVANPRGRPRNSASIVDEIEKVLWSRGKNKRAQIHDVIERWVKIATEADKDRDALEAIDKLMCRLLGAPTQRIQGEVVSLDLTAAHIEALRLIAERRDAERNNVTLVHENTATLLPAQSTALIDEEDQGVTSDN